MTDRKVLRFALVAIPILLASQAWAGAADPSSFFVSGQLGLNYYLKSGSPEDSPSEGLQLNFAPRVLYFPVRSIGVGGEANLNYYANSYKSTGLAIGPRIAYFLKFENNQYARACCLTPWLGSGWMPFVGLSLLYLSDRYEYSGNSSSSSGYRARLGLGAAPMVGDRGTMFLELGFQNQSLKYAGSTTALTSNQIYLEGGFGAFLFKNGD